MYKVDLIQVAGGGRFVHPLCCVDIACEGKGITKRYTLGGNQKRTVISECGL